MPSTLTHTGSVQFRTLLADGEVKIARDLTLKTDLADGSGTGQANLYWSGTLSLNAAASTTLDVSLLESVIFGSLVYASPASIKSLTIRNTSPGATVRVEPGATNGWSQIPGHNVGKSGVAIHYAPVDGLPVTASSRTVKFTNNATAISATGATTNGSAAVTGLASTASMVAGMAVSGTGIPAGTTVASITSGTAITLSTPATATGASVALTVQWVALVEIYVVGVRA
jgi:hypothetical protein